MSYDLRLVDPVTGDCLELTEPHFMQGGTWEPNGTKRATLNITSKHIANMRRVIDPEAGIRALYGQTGAESLPLLEKAISLLGTDVDKDLWKPTEGNLRLALTQLAALATLLPKGVWKGD